MNADKHVALNFTARCNIATACLPRDEYRAKLEALHAEMLAALERPAQPVPVGRVRVSDGELHIYPSVRDPDDKDALTDGLYVYAAPIAQQAAPAKPKHGRPALVRATFLTLDAEPVQARQPLTNPQVATLCTQTAGARWHWDQVNEFARAIEAAHGIGDAA